MNKAISVRHNKDYTSVLINKLNRKNMLIANATAIKVSREEHREAVVIKPTKKALMEYRETSHEQELMENTPIGHSFTLLGLLLLLLTAPILVRGAVKSHSNTSNHTNQLLQISNGKLTVCLVCSTFNRLLNMFIK